MAPAKQSRGRAQRPGGGGPRPPHAHRSPPRRVAGINAGFVPGGRRRVCSARALGRAAGRLCCALTPPPLHPRRVSPGRACGRRSSPLRPPCPEPELLASRRTSRPERCGRLRCCSGSWAARRSGSRHSQVSARAGDWRLRLLEGGPASQRAETCRTARSASEVARESAGELGGARARGGGGRACGSAGAGFRGGGSVCAAGGPWRARSRGASLAGGGRRRGGQPRS